MRNPWRHRRERVERERRAAENRMRRRNIDASPIMYGVLPIEILEGKPFQPSTPKQARALRKLKELQS